MKDLDSWFTSNYKFIEKWCKIWVKVDSHELISHYYIYLTENWYKIESISQEEKLKFTNYWLKNNARWSNSEFNRTRKISYDEIENWDEPEDNLIEVRCESDREDINNWLVDLFKNHCESDVERLVLLREIYLELQLHEKVLWDLYFTNMMSMRDISDKIRIPLSSVFEMIKKLKEKIINGINFRDN